MKTHYVSHLAVSNTGLLNFVTGSRLLYGMSRDKLVPAWLDAVHPRTQTPHRAILVVWTLALGLALTGTLSMLASTTNVLLLIVFATVNVALVVLRLRQQRRSRGFRVPLPIPVLAAVASRPRFYLPSGMLPCWPWGS